MRSMQVDCGSSAEILRAETVEMKLEVVVVPVSDVDRAKSCYEMLGWQLDADFVTGEAFRQRLAAPRGEDAGSWTVTGRESIEGEMKRFVGASLLSKQNDGRARADEATREED
jgi:hypothetical protein